MRGSSGDPALNHAPGLEQEEPQIHISGIFIVLLEVALILENCLPILVVVGWLAPSSRGVGDRLITALSVICILSAVIPTPLGLASYFSGSWYGGSPTCCTYQVTSIWCNLSSLALLCYICVNGHCAVRRLLADKAQDSIPNSCCSRTHQRPLPVVSNQNTALDPSPHSSQAHRNIDGLTGLSHTSSSDYSDETCQRFMETDARNGQYNETLDSVHLESKFDNGSSSIHDTSGSSFESTKLEFLTDNAQSTNNALMEKNESYLNNAEHKTTVKISTDLSYGDKNNTTKNTDVDSSSKIAENSKRSAYDEINNTSSLYNTVDDTHTHGSLYKSSGVKNQPDDITSHCDQTNHSPQHPQCVYNKQHNYHQNQPEKPYHQNHQTHLHHHDNVHNHQQEQLHQPQCDSRHHDSSTPTRLFQPRDYVSLALFFLFSITLVVSSLPVVGFGPQLDPVVKTCSSWLVPTPSVLRERSFFIAFLSCVYICMVLGCCAAARVGFLVNRRVKQELRRTTRLYHQEDNVPDLRELSLLADLKRHHSLTCLASCGILTWLPIAVMLTLQKSGVPISEATLVYSNIATSLPCLLNPLLYSLLLVRYREGYKAILERCCRKTSAQHPHRLKNVRSSRLESEVDADIISSSDGHQCAHGRPNPTFESYIDFDTDDDSTEDDEYGDIHAEDDELAQHYFTRKDGEDAKLTLNIKVSEKTPLQTSSHATSKHGKLYDVRATTSSNKRAWSFADDQSTDDRECLLTTERYSHENETKF